MAQMELDAYERVSLAQLAREEADDCERLLPNAEDMPTCHRVLADRVERLRAVADRLWSVPGESDNTTTGRANAHQLGDT